MFLKISPIKTWFFPYLKNYVTEYKWVSSIFISIQVYKNIGITGGSFDMRVPAEYITLKQIS